MTLIQRIIAHIYFLYLFLSFLTMNAMDLYILSKSEQFINSSLINEAPFLNFEKLPENITPLNESDYKRLNNFEKTARIRFIDRPTYAKLRSLIAEVTSIPDSQVTDRQQHINFITQGLNAAVKYNDNDLAKCILTNIPKSFAHVLHHNLNSTLFLANTSSMAQLLTSFGACLESKADNAFKDTLLHHACKKEVSAEMLQYYLENSTVLANHQRAIDFATPLHILVQQNIAQTSDVALIKKKLALLIAHGANCMHKNFEFKTALDIVVCKLSSTIDIPTNRAMRETLSYIYRNLERTIIMEEKIKFNLEMVD